MKRFFKDASGATAIEYALIGSLIFLVILGALSSVGVGLTGIFASLAPVFN